MPRPTGFSDNPIDDVRKRRTIQALRGGLASVPKGMTGAPRPGRDMQRAIQAANSEYTFTADAPAVRNPLDETRTIRAFHALGEAT